MPVATPVWKVAGDPPLARYRFIPGEAFKADAIPDGSAGERLLADLAAILAALHTTPPPSHVPLPVGGLGIRRWAQRLRERDRANLAERLGRSVERFVDAMAERPTVLCHVDFKGGNILVDASTRAFVWVIDFTGRTVAPPEIDLARIGLSDALRERLADHHSAMSGIALNRDARAAASRFYACRREAKQVLKGSR